MRIFSFILIALFLYSCGGGGEQSADTEAQEETIDTEKPNNYKQIGDEDRKVILQIKDYVEESKITTGQLQFLLNEEGKVRDLTLKDIPINEVSELVSQLTEITSFRLIADSMTQSIPGIPELPALQKMEKIVIQTPFLPSKDLIIPASMRHLQSIAINAERQIANVVFPDSCQLKVFSLPSNNLSTLDPSFNKLTQLEYLYLPNNLLKDFDLSNLKNLGEIVISKNPIANMEAIRERHPGVKILYNSY